MADQAKTPVLFPPVLYVGREEDVDSHYFIADAEMASLAGDEPRPIAIYKRIETGTVRDLRVCKYKSDR